MIQGLLSGLAVMLLTVGWTASAAQSVAIPAAYYVQTDSIRIEDTRCEYILPFQAPLVFNSKYQPSEKSKSTVDEELEARYEESTESINAFAFRIVKLSDALVTTPRSGDLNCYINLLSDWQQNSTLTSIAPINHVGKAVKKWTLAAISSSYLKVSVNHHAAIPPATDAAIKRWISTLAYQVKHDYSNRKPDQINNHDYWAAWAVMASSAVLDDRQLYNWAENLFVYATQQVDSQGFLPNELKREKRAAGYHNYAMQPLAMLGVFVAQNTPSRYLEHSGQLARLVDNLLLHALGEPVFASKTGVEQVDSDIIGKGRSAWLAPYTTYAVLQDATLPEVMQKVPHFRTTRLGGDLGFLFLD